MNVLVLDNYYSNFLRTFYSRHPEVPKLEFKAHRALLMVQHFGTSDIYSYNLKKFGHEAQEIIANDERLQIKWARENGVKPLPLPRYLNYSLKQTLGYDWRYKIIKAQVEHIKPYVLYIQEHNILSDLFIAKLKPLVKLIVGQVASPIPKQRTDKFYDLVLTSFPHFVERFRKKGIASDYFRLAFDERLLGEVKPINPKFDVTFVGGISKAHRRGYDLIKGISEHLPIELFGYGKGTLDRSSFAYQHHHGEVWGLDMYRTLFQKAVNKLNVAILKNILLTWQKRKMIKVFSELRKRFPDARFTVAGFGNHKKFPKWIYNQIVDNFSTDTEKKLCQIYSESRVVLGVPGSNMLLPSAHAGMTIDLMPDDRWGNFAQEILYPENDVRMGSYRYRYVPINQKPNHLHKIVVRMILDREHFIENTMNIE